MKTVMLYGHLGENFGREHRLDVNTAAEAIRALCANFKTFRQHVLKHNQPGYRVLTKNKARDFVELTIPSSADIIRIVPVVAGAGGGLGKVLLGVALIGAATFISGGALGSVYLDGSLTAVGFAASAASSIGFSLLLGGVSQMLFSPPKVNNDIAQRPTNKPSFAFDGAVNTTGQGNAVGLCYGEFLCGSQVVSTGLAVDDIPS